MSRIEIDVTTGDSTTIPLTQVELDAAAQATQQEADDKVISDQEREDNFTFDNVMITIAKAFHNHENRLRDLESKPHITLKQLVTALRQL